MSLAEKEHRAQDYAEGGLNLKINFRKLKYYSKPISLNINYIITIKMATKKEVVSRKPVWFYYVSVLAAFMFTMYISIYSTIHFDNIRYMNIVVVFLFIAIISFFIISGAYFHTENMGYHLLAPILFFAGTVSLVVYAYKAVDASNVVRYSIIYTIIVVGISLFILMPKKEFSIMITQKTQKKSNKNRNSSSGSNVKA